MARKRNPKRDEAYRLWIESKKEKLLKDIAEELGVAASTVRKWKSQDKWEGDTKRSAPNEKERYDSMKGNKNAKGNPGNKNASPPPNNKNAVSHGLFAKWLPNETKEIMSELYSSKPEDIIWNNIIIQYTAIIRAQKIMYVQDEEDNINNSTRIDINPLLTDEDGKPVRVSEHREWHMAFERQEKFLSAQSRAMGTLSNLIKQFVSLADETDERRLRLDYMQRQIDKTKAETDKITKENKTAAPPTINIIPLERKEK